MLAIRRGAVPILILLGCLSATPALASFAGTDLFLPMVGRRPGIYPSDWYTKVWVHNPGPNPADVRFFYLERSASNLNAPSFDDTIQPGDTKMYENAVWTMFAKEGFGAIRVLSLNGQKVLVSSRVYSQAAGLGETDSLGQQFAGVPASFAIGLGDDAQILGVHQTQPSSDSELRYNYGFVETTGHNATVRITVWSETGEQLGSEELSVREYSQRQVAFKDHFPAISTENARLAFEVVEGTGKIIAYGSGIANASQDPTTFEMSYPEFLMEVAHDGTLTGDGTDTSPLGLADAAVTLEKLGTTNMPSFPSGEGVQALAVPPVTVLTSDGSALAWGTAGTGDITGVAAGGGLTGGGTEDDVVLAVGAGPGIEVHADYVTIATAGVTAGMLANGAVTSAALGPGSVITSKLQDAAVTTTKLASSAVTKDKLAAVGGSEGQVLRTDGSSLVWSNDSIRLPADLSASVLDWSALIIRNTMTAPSPGTYGLVVTLGADVPVYSGPIAIEGSSSFGAGVMGGSQDSLGVHGYSVHSDGVLGWSDGEDGVEGFSRAPDGSGVHGYTSELNGLGVSGSNPNRATSGYLGGEYGAHGVRGTFQGYLGFSDGGVLGSNGTNYGYLGRANEGVLGQAFTPGGVGVRGESTNGEGVYGTSGGLYAGVRGFSASRAGVWGESTNDAGVYGTSSNGWAGYFNGKLRNSNLAGIGGHPVCADSAGVFTHCASDARLKREVVSLAEETDVLAALTQLRGVAFNWDTSVERAKNLGEQREIGMIAQEVEAVLPQVVGESADGYKSLDYPKLTAFLIEVAKAQQAQIAHQESRIQALELALAELDSQ